MASARAAGVGSAWPAAFWLVAEILVDLVAWGHEDVGALVRREQIELGPALMVYRIRQTNRRDKAAREAVWFKLIPSIGQEAEVRAVRWAERSIAIPFWNQLT